MKTFIVIFLFLLSLSFNVAMLASQAVFAMASSVFNQWFNIHRPFRVLLPRYIYGTTHFKPIFESDRL